MKRWLIVAAVLFLLYIVIKSCGWTGCSEEFMAQCGRVKAGEKPSVVFNTYDISEIQSKLQKCVDCQH